MSIFLRALPVLLGVFLGLLSPLVWAQKVRLATTAGDIVVELDRAKAPKTVDNFLAYVKSGHYNGTIFHRVIDNFMIQGGGMTASLARTSVPDSATAQFFINVADNAFLDAANARDGRGYAVFGRVLEGMEVVDQIKVVPTLPKGMHQNVPQMPITIKKATLEP